MSQRSKAVHEKYHLKTKKSNRIIRRDNFTYRLLLDVIHKYLKTKKKFILDIGCGAGTISFYLAHKKHTVLGIDISQKAITECIKSAHEIGIKNVDFKQVDFPNFNTGKKFDFIIITEVIEHLENDTEALKKIFSLLKKGGIMILSTPSIDAPLKKLGLTQRFDLNVGHLRRYKLSELKDLITHEGFKIIETKKSEGIVRNFLFLNPYAGKLVRFLNYSPILSNVATAIDNIFLKIFGESNYIVVGKRIT